MKTALLGLGAALPGLLGLLAQTAQQVTGVSVEFNGALARSYADHPSAATTTRSSGVSSGGFFSATSEPLPASLLMTVNGYYGDLNDDIACLVAETKRENTKNVTVLLVLSKCLNESSLNRIESWVADMKDKEYSLFQDGAESPIEFATTVVSGCCQELVERNKHGLEDGNPSASAATTTALLETSTASLFLSEEVLQGDLERVAGFARFGRVLGALPDSLDRASGDDSGEESERPVGVISFVNNVKSYDEVEQFERKFKVSKAFNFQICEHGKNSCKGKFENCVFLNENVDLMFYSPFTVTHSYQCEDSLEGGIPVSSVTPAGERQCFCACPAGFELQEGANGKKFCAETKCKSTTTGELSCSWNTHPFGFKHEVAASLNKCTFSKIASEWKVPVPFPSDNYVADARVNSYDDDSRNGPKIKVSAKKLPSEAFDGARLLSLSSLGDTGLFDRRAPPPTVMELLNLFAVGDVSHHLRVLPAPTIVTLSDGDDRDKDKDEHAYTWKYYQSHRRDAIDDLSFASYGKYALTLDASDYASNATCTGCLAIVDKFRPRATHKCPSGLDAGNELSTSNVKKVNNLVQQFFQFGGDAENDACSENDSKQRCDTHTWQKQDFFETSYSDVKAEKQAAQAFKESEVRSDLLKALAAKKNPLAKASDQTCANQETTPVGSGQCKRCVKLSTALKELWTDYTCGYEYDVQKCEGDANQTCTFEQCLVTNGGDALATAIAKVKSDAAKISKALSATSATEIRRELASGCFTVGKGSACQFKSKLYKLIETSASASSKSILSDSDTTKFVFWRYRVKSNGEWKLWYGSSSDEDETFAQESTKVFFEAWTPCGLVAEFPFTVVLVLPKSSGSYGDYAFAMFSSLLNGGDSNGDADGEGGVATGSSVALGSLVALVVVVVVIKRRRSTAAKVVAAARVNMGDDAYHPLLQY